MNKIENIGHYYLYRHIRLDKNESFYIGIGTKTTQNFKNVKSEFKRAYVFSNRNKIWNSIFKKTKIKVEILFESNDYEFIKQKEIEFINYYGKIDTKTGILSNLTDGGEGANGRRCPKYYVAYLDNGLVYKIYKNSDEIRKEFGSFDRRLTVSNHNNKKRYGFRWRNYFNKESYLKKIETFIKNSIMLRLKKQIYQYTTEGLLINVYDYIEKIPENFKKGSVNAVLINKQKQAYNFYWSYEKKDMSFFNTFKRYHMFDENKTLVKSFTIKELKEYFKNEKAVATQIASCIRGGCKFKKYYWKIDSKTNS